MDYLTTTATLTLAVTGYAENDYCVFYGNLGDGAIDYDTPLGDSAALYGETSIVLAYGTRTPGDYDFAAIAYDAYANASDLTEYVGTIYLDCEPTPPDPPQLSEYDDGTDILTLTLN